MNNDKYSYKEENEEKENGTMMSSGASFHPSVIGGAGGFGGFGNGGIVEGLILGAILNRRGFGDGDGDNGGCANARFLALEGGLNNLSDQIQTQSVLGAIQHTQDVASARFDFTNANINNLSTQSLLAGERTNGNIAEVKFQNAINHLGTNANIAEAKFQSALETQQISRQISDCCCETNMNIMQDGNKTRALVEAIDKQNLRDQLADTKLELSQCKQNELWMILSNKFDAFKEKQADINVALGNTVTNTATLLNSIAGKIPGLSQG